MAKKQYRVRINRGEHRTTLPNPTGRDLLKLAKLDPEKTAIYAKRGRASPQRVELNERTELEELDLRFMTLPLDQTDGSRATVTGDACSR